MSDEMEDFIERDPRFDAWLARVAPALNEPPATPRDDMWAAIAAGQGSARPGNATASAPSRVLRFRPRQWMWPAAVAAAALIGIAIDRALIRPATPDAAPAPAVAAGAPDTTPNETLYRMAAQQTLNQAEALLVAYRASTASEQKQLGAWGRDVLSSTRLLLDSPAGDDPALRELLDDLELVLVQIVRLSGAALEPAERELIDRSLREADLLPRIRSTVPADDMSIGSDD